MWVHKKHQAYHFYPLANQKSYNLQSGKHLWAKLSWSKKTLHLLPALSYILTMFPEGSLCRDVNVPVYLLIINEFKKFLDISKFKAFADKNFNLNAQTVD